MGDTSLNGQLDLGKGQSGACDKIKSLSNRRGGKENGRKKKERSDGAHDPAKGGKSKAVEEHEPESRGSATRHPTRHQPVKVNIPRSWWKPKQLEKACQRKVTLVSKGGIGRDFSFRILIKSPEVRKSRVRARNPRRRIRVEASPQAQKRAEVRNLSK